MTKEKRGKGRPTDYNTELVDKILIRIVEGEGLVKICKDEDYPNVATVYDWLRRHEDFNNRYTRAREDQADTLSDEIIDIADFGKNDRYCDSEDGIIKTDHDVIARSRLRVEARKWVAAKLKPKKYGDRVQIDDKREEKPIILSIGLSKEPENKDIV